MDEDSSDLDDEEMAMITRKFKKFFKKTKENTKRKNFSRIKNNDREQFSGCFKCGTIDHIVKNCPLLKEQESEQSRKQAREQGANSLANRRANSSARRFSRAMLGAWGDSTDEDERSEEEEDAAVALMAKSNSNSEDEPLDSLAQLKDKDMVYLKQNLKNYYSL